MIGHLPPLDIPGGDQSAAKLRMSVNSDREASSVTIPDQHHGHDHHGDVDDCDDGGGSNQIWLPHLP